MDSTIAGIARSLRSDVESLGAISQNVANMQTPGYLAKHVARSFEAGLSGGTVLNLASGALKQTGQPLDIALQGNAFFTVEAGGRTLLTRDGAFHVDNQGQLVTAAGYPVLGQAGPIAVSDANARILADGRVEDAGRVIDRLHIVSIGDPRQLSSVGTNLYAYGGPVATWEGSVETGALEQANVDPGSEMVRLIETTRHAQSLQHAMQAYDEALQTGINHLGDNN
jgi:flagellar basal-body rod protein FlgF